jgi:hypothetical protein
VVLSLMSCLRIARTGSGYVVIVRRGEAPRLPPPPHGGRAIFRRSPLSLMIIRSFPNQTEQR